VRVLVTGATGFIGGNLARALWRRGYEVRALVRPGSNTLTIDGTGIQQVLGDILDPASVSRAMEGCQGVFHCAAAYTFWARDRRTTYRTNVDGTMNVLEAARRVGVSRVVYTSTVSTVGLPPAGLGIEDTTLDPHHLVGTYKKSKYQAEQVALKLAAAGLPVVVVNPTAPVGPWDVKPTPTGRMVLDFLLGRIPAYLSTGMNLVDVEDVAEGHILALEKGRPGQRYLLGNRNLSLKEIFAMLQAVSGRRAPRWCVPFWLALGVGYVDEWVEGGLLGREPRVPLEALKVAIRPMYVSCQKAITEMGLPQSPVETALEKAVRWFTDHGYTKGRAG
jgi:dihydroflavonol-4-reductase